MTDLLLEVRNLTKHFPIYSGFFKKETARVHAVNDVSFGLKRGESLGIVGESGCGKSTLGRLINRLEQKTRGEIYFEGKEISELSKGKFLAIRKDIQMVFQNPYASLNPRKTIRESLAAPLLFHQLAKSHSEAEEKILEILDLVGLKAEALDRYPHEFSGGQQQRICIARAVLLEPKLLICDESVSALDVSVQAQILNLLEELKAKKGFTYLFISHDLSVVKHFCDRILVLYLGKVMECSSREELFKAPRHPYTKALLSALPKEHPREQKERLKLTGEIPSPIQIPLGCPFHTRCPHAKKDCKDHFPEKKSPNNEHDYFCILTE